MTSDSRSHHAPMTGGWPECHLLVSRPAHAVIRSALPQHTHFRVASDYAALAQRIATDVGCRIIVDPTLLPGDTTVLESAIRCKGAILVMLSHLTPSAARAIVVHSRLEPHALLLLPFDGPERIATTLRIGASHALHFMFLRMMAERCALASDKLIPGIVAALHGHARLDSVKTLAAFCQSSPRTVERWFHRIDVVPSRFFISARFLHARSSLDLGRSAGDAAHQSGYSRAASLWRAVRNELALAPRAFVSLTPAELMVRLEALCAAPPRHPPRVQERTAHVVHIPA